MPYLILLIVCLFFGCQNISQEQAQKEILKIHKAQRDYHFKKQVEAFAAGFSDDHVSVNRGAVSKPSKEEIKNRFQAYFDAVRFVKWDDSENPIIRFSDDRSLAYTVVEKDVLVQYSYAGEAVQDSTHFAWTAIYRRLAEGGWTLDNMSSTNTESVSQKIETSITNANCRGPEGVYGTVIHSSADGYLFFQQIIEYRNESFQAVIYDDTIGYELNEDLSVKSPLGMDVITMLKGHDFHWMTVFPNRFFHDIEANGNDKYSLQAKDELGNPVQLHYRAQDWTLDELHLLNPFNTEEEIDIYYTDFENGPFGQQPLRVEVIQAKKDTFSFEFEGAVWNSPEFERIERPKG